ncbi:hypothetical protein NPIL_294491 [Nephila pilipes]|uniref:Uncharacterized protein n=1 Tax=Nephila pilipes TaxID=299642 RepID=A0A8X6NYL1_NEPPI|nr:hypothetical protein NPIL_294491 [Nephila pilipes]
MESYIDLSGCQKLLSENSSKIEVTIVLKCLNATADSLRVVYETMRSKLIQTRMFFDKLIEHESKNELLFEDLRCSKERIEKLMKSLKFIRNQMMKNFELIYPISWLLNNSQFECCEAIVEAVEDYKRTLWIFTQIILELHKSYFAFRNAIQTIRQELFAVD